MSQEEVEAVPSAVCIPYSFLAAELTLVTAVRVHQNLVKVVKHHKNLQNLQL